MLPCVQRPLNPPEGHYSWWIIGPLLSCHMGWGGEIKGTCPPTPLPSQRHTRLTQWSPLVPPGVDLANTRHGKSMEVQLKVTLEALKLKEIYKDCSSAERLNNNKSRWFITNHIWYFFKKLSVCGSVKHSSKDEGLLWYSLVVVSNNTEYGWRFPCWLQYSRGHKGRHLKLKLWNSTSKLSYKCP